MLMFTVTAILVGCWLDHWIYIPLWWLVKWGYFCWNRSIFEKNCENYI